VRSKLQIFLFTALLSLAFYGCIEQREYPIEPVIAYSRFVTVDGLLGKDSLAYFTIEFTDGDGDIGLEQSDTLPPFNPGSEYYYNYFITFYQKVNGEFLAISTPYNSRIPDVNPDHLEKDLKGEISIEIDLNILSLVLTSDTIMMKGYIVDRALHHSNMIETPEFVLDLN